MKGPPIKGSTLLHIQYRFVFNILISTLFREDEQWRPRESALYCHFDVREFSLGPSGARWGFGGSHLSVMVDCQALPVVFKIINRSPAGTFHKCFASLWRTLKILQGGLLCSADLQCLFLFCLCFLLIVCKTYTYLGLICLSTFGSTYVSHFICNSPF